MVLIGLVFIGYGGALLVNGVAGKVLRPRYALPPHTPGSDPLAGLGLVVHVADPLFLLSFFRALAIAVLLGVMWWRGEAPPASARKEGGAVAAGYATTRVTTAGGVLLSPFVLDRALLVPYVIGVCNSMGYLFFMCLTSRGGSAVWSALVGTYVVLPCAYGIVWKGEARSPRKLAGIAACVGSTIMLSLGREGGAEAEEADSGVSWLEMAVLFLLAITCWGACDGMAAFVGRKLHTFYVALMTGLGFATTALIAAVLAYFVSAAHPIGAAGTGADTGSGSSASADASGDDVPISLAGGYALMALAQAAGVAAWYGSVLLGRLSEASAFLPITSLYTIAASVFALALGIGGAGFTGLGWAGMVVAGAGMLAIATA